MLKDSSNISKQDKLIHITNPFSKQNTYRLSSFQQSALNNKWPSQKLTSQISKPIEQKKMLFANSALQDIEDQPNDSIQQQQNNKNFPSNITLRDMLNSSSSITSIGKHSRKVHFDKLESPFQSSGKTLRILQVNKSSVQRNLFSNYEKEAHHCNKKTRSDRKTQTSSAADKSRWSLFNSKMRENLSDRFIPFHSSGSSKISSIQSIFQTDASNKQRKEQVMMGGKKQESLSSSSDQANNSGQSSSQSSDSDQYEFRPHGRRNIDRSSNNAFMSRLSNSETNSSNARISSQSSQQQ